MNVQELREVGIDAQIRILRGVPVMLDFDLAVLYGESSKAMLQAVRRNSSRFPRDFMFQLTGKEAAGIRVQDRESPGARSHGGRRVLPWAFTEQGVAMLSSVLRSETAVRVNIEIMRAFVRMRRAAVISRQLMSLIEELSSRVDSHDVAIAELVASIQDLVVAPSKRRARPIGFTADIDSSK